MWEIILLFLTVLIGGGLAFVFTSFRKNYFKLVLSFSGAYILSITVMHLLPTVYMQGKGHLIGLWILVGFFVQVLLEQLSGGLEHGHIHSHDAEEKWRAFQIMVGLSIHAFLEGMPLSGYDLVYPHSHAAEDHHIHFLTGIILHKAPAAFALVSMLLISRYPLKKVYMYLFIFSAMSPLGALSIFWLGENISFDVQQITIVVLALVIGSFLHIATTILFESDEKFHHRRSTQKIIAILLGLVLGMLTLV